jgi:hypothetical protein
MIFDLSEVKDDDLKCYHDMMNECYPLAKTLSHLAVRLWSAVLKELHKRRLIQLVGVADDDGSFDNPGSCVFTKRW